MSKRPEQRTRQGNRNRRGEAAGSFAEVLVSLVPPPTRHDVGELREREPLVNLPYRDEVAAKQEGLRRFWRAHRLDGEPEELVPSPRPRHYRTSSKRRVVMDGARPVLFLGEIPTPRQRARPPSFVASALEPHEHADVYRALADALAAPAMKALAEHLNYLIVRGTYDERVLICNVDALDGAILRRMTQLWEAAAEIGLHGCFAYLDPTRSSYHFESRRPQAPVTFKRISGTDLLSVRYLDCRYRYHPTSFSQINQSIVPELMKMAAELLAPNGRQALLDLYCGYGLFSHYLAPSFARVLGVDAEGPAIRSAVANIRLNPRGAARRFVAARIDRDFASRGLPRPGPAEAVLLDPPRNGPMHGVIAALGRRDPEVVLHVFCEVDQIPPSLERWRSVGYRPLRIVPLDMFPGSANLEVLILLGRETTRWRR